MMKVKKILARCARARQRSRENHDHATGCTLAHSILAEYSARAFVICAALAREAFSPLRIYNQISETFAGA